MGLKNCIHIFLENVYVYLQSRNSKHRTNRINIGAT
jgi:hypothetical protein